MDFSRTQRVVLLIDLQPLLTLGKPNSYLTTVLAAAKRLLTFPPLSAASLFAFKLFFSSFSPLRSSSAVHRLLPTPNSLSFSQAAQTLTSLTQALESLSLIPPILPELSGSLPSASHISSALLQLVHDYAWESETEIGNGSDNVNDFAHISSNLVVLFSPICKSLSCLHQFMNAGLNHECLDQLIVKFNSLFSVVNDAFISRDIYLSWVNVNCESQGENEMEDNIYRESLEFFEKGIRSLNWGFSSTNAIVLGSVLIPFELIYPNIGVQLNFENLSREKRSAQLSLEILDVNGKPLECKCCDLELLNLRALPSVRCDDIVKVLEFRDSQGGEFDQGKGLLSCFADAMVKLHLKAVQRNNEGKKNEGCSSNYLLVREFSGESKQSKKKCSEEFFGDKVMEILSNEPDETSPANPVPIWQILLSFLHKEGYWAVLLLSDEIGNTATGIMKPFTAHSAVLSIIDDDYAQGRDCSGSNPTRNVTAIHESCHNTIDVEGFIGSQTDTSTSGNCEPSLGDGKRRKSKKHQNLDLTWSTFCKGALECSHFDLAEVYFARKLNKSKKLKFLKCWMKQIRMCSQDSLSAVHAPKSQELLMSPTTEQCQVPEEAITFTCSESEGSESFFSNLPWRIEHGLKSKMDLQILAERVVKSAVYWLSQFCETDENMEDQNPRMDDGCSNPVFAKLNKLLLKEPKEMKEMREHNDPSSIATEPNIIVREYELQIFLRMEILGSNVSESIEEPAKRKLLKQICSFLEIIQYLVEGGVHGQINLYDYVERNIKFRYSHILEDIVNEIYTQMDLLPFGDEDEAQNLLLNSEDSNQSWRDTQEFYGKAETNNIQQSISADDGSNQGPKIVDESVQETRDDECAQRLNEARERRERARRFVSFTRRAPDLQRIWAPKQSKAIKGKPEPLQKESRRKIRRRGNESVVCETPLSGRKHPSEGERELRDGGNSHSVSKALFQDC